MGFANAESIQFYALLARRNLGLDSAICSSWGFIQNPQNWLLTSGAQIKRFWKNRLAAVSYGVTTKIPAIVLSDLAI